MTLVTDLCSVVTGQKLSAGARLDEIERIRKKKSVRQCDLADAAGISETGYRRYLRNPGPISDRVLDRLERALDRLDGRAKPKADPDLVRGVYAGFLVQMAAHYSVTVDQVRASDPQRAEAGSASGIWYRCAHARQAAIYLTNTAIAVKQRRLAELLDLTPAAVCLAIKDVEDRRDDPAFDQALKRATWMITGRDE